jgi:hypothetical protein
VSGRHSFATIARADSTTADPQETLFQRRNRAPGEIGWYVSPTSGFTSIDGDFAYTAGLRSAVVVNRTFGYGLAGNLIGTESTQFAKNDVRNIGGYAGAYVQYIVRSNSVVHAFADVTAGLGSWCPTIDDDGCQQRRDFGFLEPTVNVELNVFRWMRVSTGVGYRATLTESGPGYGSRQLSGVVARSGLIFGMF